MTKKTRRRYSNEFKTDAESLVAEQGYSVSRLPGAWGLIVACWTAGAASTVSKSPAPRSSRETIATPRSRSSAKKFVSFRLKRRF